MANTGTGWAFQDCSFLLAINPPPITMQVICMAKENTQKKTNGSSLDFEAQLWAAADKMRGHMDASEYKHVCLGLIFLKYISDAFEEKREQLLFGFSDPKSEWFIKDEPQRAEAAENRDEYLAANVFWLPPEARWHTIKAKAKSPEIGKVIDDAMGAIERENPTLKGVLPRDYARPSLDKVRLGGLVDIISNIGFNESAAKSKDVLGDVYMYFLGKFASAEGTLQSANTDCSNRRMKRVFSLSASNGGEGWGEVSKFANKPTRRSKLSWAQVAVRKHHHLETGADEPRHPRH
jgi:HsdM N-terminal domain